MLLVRGGGGGGGEKKFGRAQIMSSINIWKQILNQKEEEIQKGLSVVTNKGQNNTKPECRLYQIQVNDGTGDPLRVQVLNRLTAK
jgi:hypothetical protein